jgi:hypothetical protein
MEVDAKVQSAINCYERHKEVQKRWRAKNREHLTTISKAYYYKMKEDPEKYEKYLERCRQRNKKGVKENPEKENDPLL